jgi:hypothetical protein
MEHGRFTKSEDEVAGLANYMKVEKLKKRIELSLPCRS